MKFGFAFPTHISSWDLISYAEELGYDCAWVARFSNDLVGLLRDDGLGGAEHEANQDRHRCSDSRHPDCPGYSAFDREHQSTCAAPYLSRYRHRAYRDARDGAGPDASRRIPRISQSGSRTAGW